MTVRTASDISADLVDFRAARSALIRGERVTEVWRDGRRMTMANVTLADIDRSIADLQREYECAVAGEAGSPRRRPIRLRYSN